MEYGFGKKIIINLYLVSTDAFGDNHLSGRRNLWNSLLCATRQQLSYNWLKQQQNEYFLTRTRTVHYRVTVYIFIFLLFKSNDIEAKKKNKKKIVSFTNTHVYLIFSNMNRVLSPSLELTKSEKCNTKRDYVTSDGTTEQ